MSILAIFSLVLPTLALVYEQGFTSISPTSARYPTPHPQQESLHLLMSPAQHPKFDEALKTLRLQKRGTGGVDTAAQGSIYDISNIDRLGKSEVRPEDGDSVCVHWYIVCGYIIVTGGVGAGCSGWSESPY